MLEELEKLNICDELVDDSAGVGGIANHKTALHVVGVDVLKLHIDVLPHLGHVPLLPIHLEGKDDTGLAQGHQDHLHPDEDRTCLDLPHANAAAIGPLVDERHAQRRDWVASSRLDTIEYLK